MSNEHFQITAVAVIPPSRLRLTYADGEVMLVNLQSTIKKHPVLKQLGNAEIFVKATVGEWGGSIIWPDNENLELASDNLRALAIEQSGSASHELLWNWMEQHRLTLDAAAEALGLSRRMLAYYRSGKKPVPRTVALACIGWETEQRLAA